MTDRPIIFSASMILALLREIRAPGTGKTMTRRLITSPLAKAAPGDRLWVRESAYMRPLPNILTGEPTNAMCGAYSADDEPALNPQEFDFAWWYSRSSCPSIHMPRWASRITLLVEEVRRERLRDISEADAKAEGAAYDNEPCDHSRATCEEVGCLGKGFRPGFFDIWVGLHGADSWDANPEVVAIRFRPVLANIDELKEAA